MRPPTRPSRISPTPTARSTCNGLRALRSPKPGSVGSPKPSAGSPGETVSPRQPSKPLSWKGAVGHGQDSGAQSRRDQGDPPGNRCRSNRRQMILVDSMVRGGDQSLIDLNDSPYCPSRQTGG